MEFFLRKGTLGFFSDTFRLLETYMVCKRDDKKLYLNSSDWTFGHTLGWSDYFTSMSETTDEPLTETAVDGEHIRQFTVAQYKEAMKELFVYQPYLIEKAERLIEQIRLKNYVAVFIRRGDKLLGESLFIPTRYYVERALEKNPEAIFVQTDDFRAYIEFRQILHSINPAIYVITTCPSTKFGMFFTPPNLNEGRYMLYNGPGYKLENAQNLQYLSQNIPQRPLIEYTKDEMREHVEEMLIGIIICQRARFVVLDHMSNVSRFIDFTHPQGKEAVLSIEDMNIKLTEHIHLIKRYDYDEDKLIRNPRHHSIYNDYI
jgi:hypothetical protein